MASAAEPRFLAGDEGTAIAAWVGAAIAMVGMLVAACALGTAAFMYQRHRNRSNFREVQKVQVKSTENSQKKSQAWPESEVRDAELGETVLEKASPSVDRVNESAVVPEKLSASVRMELAETLRGILEDEIGRGLKASGISDRLDRLEQQAREQQVLSGSLLPPSQAACPTAGLVEALQADLDYTVKASSQAASAPASEFAETLKPEAKASKRDADRALTDQSLRDEIQSLQREQAALTEERDVALAKIAKLEQDEQSQAGARRKDSGIMPICPVRNDLTLSPSARQKRYPDPPEKGWMQVDEDRSLRLSMGTLQRNLQKRDGQTQELHRQLRQTQQDCQRQKLEATWATQKLQDLLSNPKTAPQVQAQEMQGLRKSVDSLSSQLADSKQSEMQLQIVAMRQRAFFMQSERVAQEGVNLFRKHPAGELFLAPPPVYLEDDMDEDPRKPPWDVGSSHINPYVNDSWPFEPNACAQRCAVEPNLGRWDEEDGLVDTDSEDGSQGSGGEGERAQLMLRLPTLPPESPQSGEEPEPPEEAPAPLPALGTLSARSL